MKVDRDVVERKIDIIETALNDLADILENDDISHDRKSLAAAKYFLLESIEASLDIANHIISSLGYRRPEDYKDMFKVLFENKVTGKQLSEKLMRMAQFRNVLIHRYDEIDTRELLSIIKDDIVDIKDFVKIILKKFS